MTDNVVYFERLEDEDMKNIHLKDCPFCGWAIDEDLSDILYPSGQLWRIRENGMRTYHSWPDRQPGDNMVWSMNCTENMGGCGAEIFGNTLQEAIEKWNRRV